MTICYLCCNCAAAAASAASGTTHARNEWDVLIVGIICLSIIIVVGITSFTILRWHGKELKANTPSTKDANACSNGKDDAAKKHYIDKLLILLESQTKSDAKLDKDACIIYENTLRGLAGMETRNPNSDKQ